jgi:integrase/recombinase XerD
MDRHNHPSQDKEPQMATMSPLRQRMLEDMTIRNFSPATQQSYIYAVAKFSRYFGCSPERLSLEQVRNYQLYLIKQKRSWGHINQVACALRFFYGVTLGRAEAFDRIVGGHKPDKLPLVLNTDEIARFLKAVPGLRNRVVLTTAYAAGLRISEVVCLKVSAIDSKRKLIHIENGKGGRDRYAMLSPHLLRILRAYWKQVRPGRWLFPGRDPGDHVTVEAIQDACRSARRRARIGKPVTVHSLRHSFATHLLERGVDIRIIQVLLGHIRLDSTARYAQVATNLIASTGSPFDQITVELIPPD